MHDTQYRAAIAWQNSGYNQPPHPSFFLGAGMTPPPSPNIRLIGNGEAIMAHRGAALPAQVETPMTDPNGGESSRTEARLR